MLAKAPSLTADEVIVDLEDAVAAEGKEQARVWFAANLASAEESDIVPAEKIDLADDKTVTGEAKAEEARRELWKILVMVAFAVLTTTYAINQRLRPPSRRIDRFFRMFTLERGGVAGLSLVTLGMAAVGSAAAVWMQTGFGALDYATTMRLVIPGATVVVLGASIILNSFLCSMLGLARQ